MQAARGVPASVFPPPASRFSGGFPCMTGTTLPSKVESAPDLPALAPQQLCRARSRPSRDLKEMARRDDGVETTLPSLPPAPNPRVARKPGGRQEGWEMPRMTATRQESHDRQT